MERQKKTKKVKPPSKKEVSPTESTDGVMEKTDKLDVDKLLAQAFTRHKMDLLIGERKEKFKEVTHLATMAEEYLSCFSLIGYNFQGEKVCVFSAPTSKDEAALVDLLRSTFLEIANNRP